MMTWWAWLGWDTEYQFDPSTQTYSGPYEAWQVIGCGLTFAAVAVAAALLLPPWLVTLVMPIAFTIAWSVRAAGSDDTGLWGVGAVLVLIGTAMSAAVLAFGTFLARWLLNRARLS